MMKFYQRKSNCMLNIIQNKNGSINIRTKNTNDADKGNVSVIGANIEGKDINIDVANNLIVESLQNKEYSNTKSENYGGSVGGSAGAFGLNFGGGFDKKERNWVDNQTSIIGNNSVVINTKNNTDIKGAVIASGSYNDNGDFVDNNNLSLSTKTLTYSDIYDNDTEKRQNIGGGLGTTVSFNYSNGGKNKEQTTKATIGNGNIVIADNNDISGLNRNVNKSQEITKSENTGGWNVDVSLNVPGLIELSQDGFDKFTDKKLHEAKINTIELGQKTNEVIENIYEKGKEVGNVIGGEAGGTIFEAMLKYTIGSTIGGAISAFGEDGRTKDNYVVNNKVYDTWDEAIKDNPNIDTYNMGGVGTDLAGALKVSDDHPDSINRVNASDGLIGDTIEAGISALLGLTPFTSDFSALGRMQADDLRNVRDETRVDIKNYNTHSEGTIAFNNGLQVYINRHGETDKLKGIDYNALGYATYKESAQDKFNKIKDPNYIPDGKDKYEVTFDKMPGDPVSGLASPTLKDNLFTIMYNAVKGKVSLRDHYEDNAYYDDYFGKTNLVNRQLINQSRGKTESFNNINNSRTKYVMPYENQNNKK